MSTSTLNIDGSTGVPIVSRLVLPGMGYGLWYRGVWSLVHEKIEPMVEFYDHRNFNSVHGQFISRYLFSTLDDRKEPGGLMLDTATPDWAVDADALQRVLDHFRGLVHEVRTQAQQGLRIYLATRDNSDGAGADQPVLYGPDDLWWPVTCLNHASDIVRQYAAAIGIGHVAWTGGRIEDAAGNHVGDVDYHGRVYDPAGATLCMPAHVRDFPTISTQEFFEATGTRSTHTMPERHR